MSLSGKTLFITGASRGIGLAIALRAARDGANIAIAAKTAEPHPKLAGTIHTAARDDRAGRRPGTAAGGGRARGGERDGGGDATAPKPSAASTSASTTPRRSIWRRPTEIDMRRYDLIQQINTRGTFVTTRACLPYLQQAPNPHVLTLSPPLDLQPKWFARAPRVFAVEVRHVAVHARASPRSTAPRASPATRCGRAPRSPRPRWSSRSAARRCCAAAASRRSWRTPPT